MSPHTIPQVSKPEAPKPILCPQVKSKPCHKGWRAAGLLLLLTLLTAGAMAGTLLGFMYNSPTVSTSSSLRVCKAGRGQEGQV